MKAFSRREFSKLSLAALPALGLSSILNSASAAEKPNSKVAGVQIGLNVPYSFGNGTMSAEEILKNCVQLGISGVELRMQPVEIFLGAPAELVFPKKDAGPSASADMAGWRKTPRLEKASAYRKMYEDAGVLIEVLKVDGIFKMSDEELDHSFALAKTLGARAISSEISRKEEELKRVGQFADKHRMMVGYHGHAETTPEDWEKAFALAKFNAANVDIGHFVAGNNVSPVEFIKKRHDRITHVHIKDRKKNKGPNTPFGEGDTPIGDVLRLIRDNKWNIQATIEFEYKVPEGSDRMTEIARAIKYCRDALAA